MVKFILKEADENSPIYKTGFILSNLKLNKSINIRHKGDKSMSRKPLFLIPVKNKTTEELLYEMVYQLELHMVLRSKISLRI